MRFKIQDKQELLKRININLKAVDKNPIIDTLSNFKISICDDKMSITSYDMENCIITYVYIENIDDLDLDFLIDAKTFKTILDKLNNSKSSSILFEVNNDISDIKLISGRTKVAIKINNNISDFTGVPSIETYEDFKTVTFKKNQFKRAISNVSKCAIKDSAKPMLEAISIIVDKHSAEFMALDGYKLAVNKIDCESVHSFRVSVSSSKINSLLSEALKTTFEFIEINSNGKYLMIEDDDVTIFIKEMNGDIPDYKSLLSKRYSYLVNIDTNEIIESVTTATISSSDGNSLIGFNFNPDSNILKITSNGNIIKDYNDEIDVIFEEKKDEDLDIYFNGKYLLSLLSNISTENCVLYLNDSVSPAFIEEKDNLNDTYLVLPIRVKKY